MPERKSLRSYVNLPRLAPISHFKSAEQAYSSLSSYGRSDFLRWAFSVGKYWLRPKHRFVTYKNPADGIFPIPNDVKISIAGDWGTGTHEAADVAKQIKLANPDYTIHLGDIYFVGDLPEIDENFLGIKSSQNDPVEWPRGLWGTFTLCGNHDMYTNGDAFYDVLLWHLGQKTSYFCLENDNWRIIALDTGYNSTGFWGGLTRSNAGLPKEVIQWLTDTVQPNKDKRGLIILTHHQPWSSFERGYPKPAQQLSKIILRPFTWIWGHEHRMAIYGATSLYGCEAQGRCVGHGGMPVDLKTPSLDPHLIYTDTREYPNSEGIKVGYNGHVNLTLRGLNATMEYKDLEGTTVYEEDGFVSNGYGYWTEKRRLLRGTTSVGIHNGVQAYLL